MFCQYSAHANCINICIIHICSHSVFCHHRSNTLNMVNKFGDCIPQEIANLPPIHIIKKVTYTKGTFLDYYNEIIASYRLGCTPYRIKTTQSALPVYTFNNRVFSNGSICIEEKTFQHISTAYNHMGQLCATEEITHSIITETNSLVIFEEGSVITDIGEIVAIQGKEGLIGQRGPNGSKGERGPKGNPGSSGFSFIARWFPSQTIEWFRENEDCCYYFKQRNDFIWSSEKPSKILGFKTHSKNGENAINLKPTKETKIVKLSSRRAYCVEFNNSLFRVKNVEIANGKPSYTVVILTFKLDIYPTEEQFIVTTAKGDRSISVKEKNIKISGFTYDMEFLYNFRKWNTLYVQWTNMDDMKGWVYFGDNHVELTTTTPSKQRFGIYIGAKKSKRQSFVGCLAALEIYEAIAPPEKVFPAEFRKMLIKDQEDMVEEM